MDMEWLVVLGPAAALALGASWLAKVVARYRIAVKMADLVLLAKETAEALEQFRSFTAKLREVIASHPELREEADKLLSETRDVATAAKRLLAR
jgi:hypothetical protein